jgi:hypothetical protein
MPFSRSMLRKYAIQNERQAAMYQAHKAGQGKQAADDLGDRNQRLADLRKRFPKVFYHPPDAWKTPRQMAAMAARKKTADK